MASVELTDEEKAIHNFMREIVLYFENKAEDITNIHERHSLSNLERFRCDYLTALKKNAQF